MTVHAVTVDWSPDTGSLVVCTCGLVLGPYNDYEEAKKVGREHARWMRGELVQNEEQRLERRREGDRRRRAAKDTGDA